MATTKQALYTITLVEVTYASETCATVPSLLTATRATQVRTMRGATALTMRVGRRETRTALLVDVPQGELAEARALVERSVWAANERDGGERYIACERQRGRVMRETTRRNHRAA